MGTRSLVMVVKEQKTKVAQYVQFDGYPSGVGVGLLSFLHSDLVEKLKENLSKCRFLDDEIDKEFLDCYNKNTPEWSNEPDKRTPEQLRWWKSYMDRGLGEDVLVNIANSEDSEILISNKEDFAKDSLFCEWAYVIDFDSNKLEVYEGFVKNKPAEGNRFGCDQIEDDYGYYPVTLVNSFDLSNLPDKNEFLKVLDSSDIND